MNQKNTESSARRESEVGHSEDSYYSSKFDDEIDLYELWRVLVEGRRTIAFTLLLSSILSIAITLWMPDIYRAEVLLAPADNDSNAMSGLSNQFGGLASLAGVNIAQSQMNKTDLALEVLQSRSFIIDFIRQHDLRAPLMAADGWDPEKNHWNFDASVYDSARGEWLREKDADKPPIPSDLQAYSKFKSLLKISQDQKSSMVRVGIELESPQSAKQWADWLVADLNERIKQRDIKESRKSIEYLQKQIPKTALAEARAIFYKLIEEQTKRMMLAEVRDEYAFSIIDPAVVPEEKISPKRSRLCILGVLLGGVLSVIGVFIRHIIVSKGI